MPLKLVGRLYEAVVPNPAGILMDAVPNVAAGKGNIVFNYFEICSNDPTMESH